MLLLVFLTNEVSHKLVSLLFPNIQVYPPNSPLVHASFALTWLNGKNKVGKELGEGVTVGVLVTLGVILGVLDILIDAPGVAEGDCVGEIDIEGVTDGVALIDIDGVALKDIEGVVLGVLLILIEGVVVGEMDIEGVTDGVLVTIIEGETDIDGVLEGVSDGVNEIEGVIEGVLVTEIDGVAEGVGDKGNVVIGITRLLLQIPLLVTVIWVASSFISIETPDVKSCLLRLVANNPV